MFFALLGIGDSFGELTQAVFSCRNILHDCLIVRLYPLTLFTRVAPLSLCAADGFFTLTHDLSPTCGGPGGFFLRL